MLVFIWSQHNRRRTLTEEEVYDFVDHVCLLPANCHFISQMHDIFILIYATSELAIARSQFMLL